MPKEGFNVITIRKEVFERAKEAFEARHQKLEIGTSFSKFVSDLILHGLEVPVKEEIYISTEQILQVQVSLITMRDRA